MLYKITTEGGALYHVDTDKQTACRVTGDPATEYRTTKDGVMRPYLMVRGIAVGSRLGIWWGGEAEGKVRVTSPVVSIENEPSTVVA